MKRLTAILTATLLLTVLGVGAQEAQKRERLSSTLDALSIGVGDGDGLVSLGKVRFYSLQKCEPRLHNF